MAALRGDISFRYLKQFFLVFYWNLPHIRFYERHNVLNYDITCAIYLFLIVPPTVAIRKNEYLGEVGLEITLECDVLSDPLETAVYWRRDVRGEMSDVDTSLPRYSRTSPSSPFLTIMNLETSDSGKYQCFADNEVGTGSSQETSLKVLCKWFVM